MTMREGPRKRLSVSAELNDLRSALEGIRLLLDRFAGEPPESWTMLSSLPRSVVALVELLDHRVRHLDRAVRGHVDPGDLWASHSGFGPADDEEKDVRLVAWSPELHVRHLRRQVGQAGARLESSRSRKGRRS